jgi:hypothetical protein
VCHFDETGAIRKLIVPRVFFTQQGLTLRLQLPERRGIWTQYPWQFT